MEMAGSTMYQFRIDADEKKETFEILEQMGIKPAQAVRLFFRQIRKTHSIPFAIEHTPNEKTAKSLLLSDAEKDYKDYSSVDDLFSDIRK